MLKHVPAFTSGMRKAFRFRGLKAFRASDSGVSAVEFALIAPLLILLYLGSVELSFLMQVNRRVTSTAAGLGDLTARLATVTDDDMSEMFQAAGVMLEPYDVTKSRMRITSIVDSGDGVAKVDWSDAYGMSPLNEGQTVTVPEGIMPSPGSVILAEVEYDYSSEIGYIIQTSKTIEDEFYLRPRRVTNIPRTGSGGTFVPTS